MFRVQAGLGRVQMGCKWSWAEYRQSGMGCREGAGRGESGAGRVQTGC